MPVYARKKGRFRRASRLLLIFMAAAVAVRFAWVFITETDFFALKDGSVTITGNSMVSENDLRALLGINYGMNIFSYSLGEIAGRLEHLDRVKSVSVKRNFPDGIYIEIEEVNPVGYTFRGDVRCAVTECGEIFAGPEGPPVKFIIQEKEAIKKIAFFLERIRKKDAGFYNSIIAVDLNYRGDVILHTHTTRLIWPPLEDLAAADIKRNISIYSAFNAQQEKKAKSIDFRFITASQGVINGSIIAGN